LAQYTPSSGDYVRPHRSPWGAFPVRQFKTISTNAAMEIGTLVTISTGAAVGGVSQLGILPSTGAGGLGAINIVGFTAEKSSAYTSSAVEGQLVSVWEANPLVEYKATTVGGAQASSVVGLRKALQYDSTLKIHRIDLTASTATDWRVVITQNLGAEGDSGGYMAFRFIGHLSGQIGSTIESSSPLLAFYS